MGTIVNLYTGVIKNSIRFGCRFHPRIFIRGKATGKGKQELTFDIGGKKQTVVDVDQVKVNKFFNWFSTLRGQKTVGALFIMSSIGAAGYHIAPHTFFRDRVRELYQSYNKGLPSRVSREMKGLFGEVTSLMGLTPSEVDSVELFVSTLQEPAAWGDLEGGLLGYPEYFHWNTVEDVPLHSMRFGGGGRSDQPRFLSSEERESEVAKLFSSSLVLSDDAKRFVLAREVSTLQRIPHIIISVVSATWILLTYNIARVANKQLEMFKKPPIIRGSMYNMLAIVSGLGYLLIRDWFSRKVDRETNREVANISSQYARGGVEFYTKKMQRNNALRTLQPSLASKYTMDEGDIVSGIVRVPHISISEMRDICERRV